MLLTGVPNVDEAYKIAIRENGQQLHRGHMNPSNINSFDEKFMKATFTLTNAAPQFQASNSGPWRTFEKRIAHYAKTCNGTLYLLTGTSDYGLIKHAITGKAIQDTTIPLPYTRSNFGSVTLVTPRALWTAGCCVRGPDGSLGYLMPRAPESFAVMSNNQKDSNLLHQTEMSIAALEMLLTAPGTQRVNLFPGNSECRDTVNYITPL